MGLDILDLTIDNIMETGDEYCKKWVRYLDKYGLPFNNAMVFQEEHNVWRPMTHEDILPYEEFFSYFIGKKVVICGIQRQLSRCRHHTSWTQFLTSCSTSLGTILSIHQIRIPRLQSGSAELHGDCRISSRRDIQQ